jgi:tetratricopeptide (TPR) repeat protein
MTDDPREHEFSSGQGFDDPYEGFDLDPEIAVDADVIDPVDSHALPDQLDEAHVDPGGVDAESLLDVGISYIRINRHEQAAEALERAARYAEDEAVEQEAWINKGVAHAELEEYDPAIGAYEEALSIDEDGEHAAVAETNLAYALWEFGRVGEALEHAERAVELDPRFGEAWYNRGLLLNERGLSEDALNSFENAIRLGYRSADLLEEQAIALEAVGQDERAQEVAEEAEAIREEQQDALLE